MAYKQDNRKQGILFPESISDYISSEDPVRVYDEFIELLDLEELGIILDPNKKGTSSYNPKMLLKVLVYSYSYGWKSSRKIERALHHNLSFIWLAGGLKPDHKTINRFRRKNKKLLKGVLSDCARVCYDLKLITGNTLFVDGSKFRANAGTSKSKTEEGWKAYKKHIDKKIAELLEEIDKIDDQENGSMIAMSKELSKKKNLSRIISKTLDVIAVEAEKKKELELEKKSRLRKSKLKINSTDSESRIIKGRQGSHQSYNVQMTTDGENGLIVSLEATASKNDLNNLTSSIKRAELVTGNEAKIVCADGGYSSVEDIVNLDNGNRNILVPNTKLEDEGEFSRNNFKYDEENDLYICPSGEELGKKRQEKRTNGVTYLINKKETCLSCKHFGKCTSSKMGRSIARSNHEKLKQDLHRYYISEEGQKIYKQRKEKAEHQFGHLKKNLGFGQFSLRGKEGANAELGILGTCFNLRRMITILGGVTQTLKVLRELSSN